MELIVRQIAALFLLLQLSLTAAFLSLPSSPSFRPSLTREATTTSTSLASSKPSKTQVDASKKTFTLKELQEEIKRKPASFETAAAQGTNSKKGKYKRSRKRVDNPQQQYLYAAQRKALEQEGKLSSKRKKTATSEEGEEDSAEDEQEISTATESVPVTLAREYGLTNPSAQHCDALVDDAEPQILGQIRVGDDMTSGSYVYVIHKPAGWTILGGTPNSKKKNQEEDEPVVNKSSSSRRETVTRLEIKDSEGSSDILEYSESDLLAVMTPEEIEAYKAEMASANKQGRAGGRRRSVKTIVVEDDEDFLDEDIDFEELGLNDDELALLNDESFELDEMELLAMMTPEELAEYEQEVGPLPEGFQSKKASSGDTSTNVNNANQQRAQDTTTKDTEPLDQKTAEVYSKIEARKASAKAGRASFEPATRPSVVTWLKDLKAQEGTPIRGGKFWTGLAGATNVDDSGIVILCPKAQVDNVFVDYLEYTAVVGNAKYTAPKQKGVENLAKDQMNMDIVSKVRRGRGEDTVQTVKVMVPEILSSCSSIVQACQQQFQDGIRGDPAGNPLGRLANRRLIHCNSVSVSSLTFDETVETETESVPDDIAILAERRNQHQYKNGSFLGRAALKANPLTNAYREINGAADGFPGWTVDRYDRWLFVQHDDKVPRGPLPSIHDGNTAGVYYLPANPNRSAMGSSSTEGVRPQLLEGQAAPDIIPILENGISK